MRQHGNRFSDSMDDYGCQGLAGTDHAGAAEHGIPHSGDGA